MKGLITILFCMVLSIAFSQSTNPVYKTPYKSVAKQLLINERLFSYHDDYRTYVFLKPTLVEEAEISVVVRGRIVQQYKVRVSEYHNIFELKRQRITYAIFVVINDYLHIVTIPKLD